MGSDVVQHGTRKGGTVKTCFLVRCGESVASIPVMVVLRGGGIVGDVTEKLPISPIPKVDIESFYHRFLDRYRF